MLADRHLGEQCSSYLSWLVCDNNTDVPWGSVSHSVLEYHGNLLLVKDVLAIGRYRPWAIALSSAILSEALGP